MSATVSSIEALGDLFRLAVDRCVDPRGGAVILYSGGLDSSLVAWCARTSRPELFTIGTEDSHDLAAAREGARLLGLPHRCVSVDGDRVVRALDRWGDELRGLKEPDRSVTVALALALEEAPRTRILCGQGADEIFHGYAHFRGLDPDRVRRRARFDWGRLAEEGWPRAQKMAEGLGKTLVSPYLDPEFSEPARSWTDAHPPIPGDPPKAELRAVARCLGLPSPLVERPKKALQYGSGVRRLLRDVAGDVPRDGRSGSLDAGPGLSPQGPRERRRVADDERPASSP